MPLRVVALLLVVVAAILAPAPALPPEGRHQVCAATHLAVDTAVIPEVPAPPALAAAVALPDLGPAQVRLLAVPPARTTRLAPAASRPPVARRKAPLRDARGIIRRQRPSAHLPRLEPDPLLS